LGFGFGLAFALFALGFGLGFIFFAAGFFVVVEAIFRLEVVVRPV
jgi:hypothetical protein